MELISFSLIFIREQLTLSLDDWRFKRLSVHMRRANLSRFVLFKTTKNYHSVLSK